ncbi:MAG: hypothetical protein IKE24_05015 [Clostridia bacterium]|nr:hypothetical protein [Clostridia bacterium]
MTKVIGIQFQQNGKEFPYDAGEYTPEAGNYVIVETSRGLDLGEVAREVREWDAEVDGEEQSLPKVVRMATVQDIQRATDNRAREQEAYRICCQKIVEHRLEMKLVSVEVLFDNSKILFYFTANGRVDFRALVKDLASAFRTRIELRQIGVRDEARMLGGLGPCGRPICCGSFLNDFQPVSIKMAKEQNLSLNPTKISGVCGRLMCCLKYEQEQYEETRKRMPRVGREVQTPDGVGVVSDLNIVKETVSVRMTNGDSTEIKEYPLEKISRAEGDRRSAPEQRQPAAEQRQPEAVPEEKDGSDPMDGEIPETGAEEAETQADPEGTDAEEKDRENARGRQRRQPRTNGSGSSRFGPKAGTGSGEGGQEPKPRKEKEARAQRPKKNERAGKQNGEEAGERNKPRRDQKFGQPVRRENPNRPNAAGPENADAPAPEKRKQPERQPAPVSEAEKSAAAPKKQRNWADAVEQALKATDG